MIKNILILLLLLSAAAWAAPSVKPENMTVLVIGPSSDRIDPDEQQVVARLVELRRQFGLEKKLIMGTMHFDRPREAQLAKSVLGIQETDLVCLTLVQLDAKKKMPVRRLYSIPRVTRASLDQVERMVQTWASMGGVSTGSMPGLPIPTRSTGVWQPDPNRPRIRGQVYSTDGMLNTVKRAEFLAASLYDGVKNQPLRRDRSDQTSRQELLGVVEQTRNVRIAFEEGRGNPKDRLEWALRARDNFRRTQPELSLPLIVRSQVPQLMEALDQLEAIYFQLNP